MVKFKNKKTLLWLILAAFIAFTAVYGLIRVLGNVLELPPEFLAARQEAGRLSQEIVELTNKTNSLIKNANIFELDGQPGVALQLIEEARKKNKDAYQKAFELSVVIQKLTEKINLIDSSRGQQLAYEAVSFELALISNFISYTQNLNGFLDNLELAVRLNTPESRRRVTTSLAEVNQKILNINNLNRDFLIRMTELDSL